MYCTAPLSPRKGHLRRFRDDDDDDDDDDKINVSLINRFCGQKMLNHRVFSDWKKRRLN